MKKSKVLLVVISSLLEIAAAAATKTNHKSALPSYYFTNGLICIFSADAPPVGCDFDSGVTCTIHGNFIFRSRNAGQCTHPIYDRPDQ